MGRAPCCDKASVKKGPWSPEEDAKLKEFIHKFGTGGNWIALPQKAGLKRCGKSCRLRWLNYLRPNIKHGEFSDEEDRIICALYATIGSRWSIMAGQLPGRTDNDIKNYWNTKLKKKLMGLNTSSNDNNASVQPFAGNYNSLLVAQLSSLSHMYSAAAAAAAAADHNYYNQVFSQPCKSSVDQSNFSLSTTTSQYSSSSYNNNNNDDLQQNQLEEEEKGNILDFQQHLPNKSILKQEDTMVYDDSHQGFLTENYQKMLLFGDPNGNNNCNSLYMTNDKGMYF